MKNTAFLCGLKCCLSAFYTLLLTLLSFTLLFNIIPSSNIPQLPPRRAHVNENKQNLDRMEHTLRKARVSRDMKRALMMHRSHVKLDISRYQHLQTSAESAALSALDNYCMAIRYVDSVLLWWYYLLCCVYILDTNQPLLLTCSHIHRSLYLLLKLCRYGHQKDPVLPHRVLSVWFDYHEEIPDLTNIIRKHFIDGKAS